MTIGVRKNSASGPCGIVRPSAYAHAHGRLSEGIDVLDRELRERAEAAGADIAALEAMCEQRGGHIDAMRAIATAEANVQLARSRERDAEATEPLRAGVGSGAWRRQTGPSVVMSIRFDHDEYDELRRRAAARGVGASVLARGFVRQALGSTPVRFPD